MKKSLIAIAVVGAFSAPAFADTTMYGLVDGAVVNLSNTGQRSQTLMVSGGLATSRFGVKTSEDLGDGLKAIVNLEYALDAQSNTGIGTGNTALNSGTIARQQLLGLSGSWGTIATGFLQTTAKDFGDKYDPAAGSAVSPVMAMTKGGKQFMVGAAANATRAQRAFAYISPNMEGFSLNLNYSTALGAAGGGALGNAGVPSGTADSNATATLVGLYYDQGPASVGFVYTKVGSPTAATTAISINDEKEWALGGSYDFGVAKVLASYQTANNDAPGAMGNSDKLYSISGIIPAGPGAVVLEYAKAKIGTDPSGNSDGNGYTGAYLYSLSKTATLYAAYSHVSNGSNTANFSVDTSAIAGGTAGGSSNEVAFGLSKKF
jgi:predicted porin